MNESHYIFVYWIVGTFFQDVETLTLSVGIIRSFESIGSCVSFGLGAAKISPMANLVVAFCVVRDRCAQYDYLDVVGS